ncbi:MAG: methylenetetrahydrofolate reductase [NAD(P)H] [Bacteroidetes bacterium GWE2_29_8]|nr:MAG: methylenetetrahydrofolate reductase [NAD(P)H] [Bacteroidetes bacterium GWE2_29_8]
MKLIDVINKSKTPYISFEILPPLKGQSIDKLFSILDVLMQFSPPFINVTYHRSEFVYKEKAGGIFEKVAVRKRPGTVGICSAIMHRYQTDSVAHIICGGFSKQETEDALIDLDFLGVKNILALRGDPAKNEKHFEPEIDGHSYAIDLVKQIVNMNKGIYLDEDLKNAINTDFCVGVAGYPEKHYEAANYQSDLRFLKAKVDAGADYIVTQMFFDNQKYFKFVDDCRAIGINIPIIPGIKTITNKKQIYSIPKIFHIDIPDDLYKDIFNSKDDKTVCEIGCDWSIEQSKELIKYGVPCLHYYTMSNPEPIVKIIRKVF